MPKPIFWLSFSQPHSIDIKIGVHINTSDYCDINVKP